MVCRVLVCPHDRMCCALGCDCRRQPGLCSAAESASAERRIGNTKILLYGLDHWWGRAR